MSSAAPVADVRSSDLDATAGAGRPARSLHSLTAIFVRAAGMADDTAVAWLDGVHHSWEQLWALHGRDVLAELDTCGHTRLVERLVELLGVPRS